MFGVCDATFANQSILSQKYIDKKIDPHTFYSTTSTGTDRWRVELVEVSPSDTSWGPEFTFQVNSKTGDTSFELVMGDITRSIEDIFIHRDTLVVQGAHYAYHFHLYDLNKQKLMFRFSTGNVAVSPSNRFIASSQHFSKVQRKFKEDSISHKVRVYDLGKEPSENVDQVLSERAWDYVFNEQPSLSHSVAGFQVYPDTPVEQNGKLRKRFRIRDFTWSPDNTKFAFVAFDELNKKDHLVMVDLTKGNENPDIYDLSFERGEIFKRKEGYSAYRIDEIELDNDGVFTIKGNSVRGDKFRIDMFNSH